MRHLTIFLKNIVNLVLTYGSGIAVTYALVLKNPNYNWIEFALFMFVGIVVGLSVDSVTMVILNRKYGENYNDGEALAKAIMDEYERRENSSSAENTVNK